MLKPLIKYEWKAMAWKYAAPFLVYLAALALGAILIHAGGDARVWGFALIFGGLFALAVVVFLAFFQRYHRNLYGAEGHLMFTLPVRGEALLFAKLLVSFIWFTIYLVLCCVVVLVCGAVISGIVGLHPDFSAIWSAFAANWNEFLLMLLYYIVLVLGSILEIYFAITVAHLELWGKFGKLMGFLSYVVVTVVQYLPFWIIDTVLKVDVSSPNLFTFELTTSAPGKEMVQMVAVPATTAFWVSLAYITAFYVGVFFLTSWLMRRHTSIK